MSWLSILLVTAMLVQALPAVASATHTVGHDCRYEGGKIRCRWTGGNPGVRVSNPIVSKLKPRSPGGPWLRTGTDPLLGRCWFWSTSPPGLDSSKLINEGAIIAIVTSQSPCSGEEVVAQAWEVFRSFALAAPAVTLQPATGITGLDTYLSVAQPPSIDWSGVLPSGVPAEVEASITNVRVEWGDGTERTYPLTELDPYPDGSATHLYHLKTCPPEYRSSHPSGPLCHPSLEAYPVTVTYRWFGRFRTGAIWVGLGVLERSASLSYDVDEVIGVLQP
jgi:hypothetical protein